MYIYRTELQFKGDERQVEEDNNIERNRQGIEEVRKVLVSEGKARKAERRTVDIAMRLTLHIYCNMVHYQSSVTD